MPRPKTLRAYFKELILRNDNMLSTGAYGDEGCIMMAFDAKLVDQAKKNADLNAHLKLLLPNCDCSPEEKMLKLWESNPPIDTIDFNTLRFMKDLFLSVIDEHIILRYRLRTPEELENINNIYIKMSLDEVGNLKGLNKERMGYYNKYMMAIAGHDLFSIERGSEEWLMLLKLDLLSILGPWIRETSPDESDPLVKRGYFKNQDKIENLEV